MGFYFQDDMYEAVSALPEKAKEQVIVAIVRYYFEGVEPSFNGSRKALFTAFKKRIQMSKSNAETGQDVRDLDVSTMESLRRIREQGRTVDDLRAVARFKAMQWRGDRRMCRFVRPSTLFGGKFEEYLAETREEAEHERRFAKYD